MQSNELNKLALSKETLRELTARPLSAEEVAMVAGASQVGCGGSFSYCAGSTGCNSAFDYCPER